jgi:hypothetical protein
LVAGCEASSLSLGQCALQLARRHGGGEIEDRARRRCDRDTAELADVASVERGDAMHADPGP